MLTLNMSLSMLMFTSILASFILITTKKNTQSSQKMSAFECGFNPTSPTRAPFSLRFFLLAILFLIFDVEISLILPIPLSSSNLSFTMTSLTFLLILNLGLFYEWKKQSLEWK